MCYWTAYSYCTCMIHAWHYFMIINSLSPLTLIFPVRQLSSLGMYITHSVIVPEVRIQEQSPLFHLPPQSLQNPLHLTLLIVSTETVRSLCARGEGREGREIKVREFGGYVRTSNILIL